MSDSVRRDSPPGVTKTKSGGAGSRASRSPGTAADAPGARDKSAFEFNEHSGDDSIPSLLRRLVDQGSHLAEKQTELVQAEIRSSFNDVKQATGAMAGAAVVGIAGLGVLLMGLSFLLATALPLWLATMIVAAATLVGAYALYAGGRKQLESSAFDIERTRRTIERAPDAMTGHTHEKNEEFKNDRR